MSHMIYKVIWCEFPSQRIGLHNYNSMKRCCFVDAVVNETLKVMAEARNASLIFWQERVVTNVWSWKELQGEGWSKASCHKNRNVHANKSS
jgi:hypothetical protein